MINEGMLVLNMAHLISSHFMRGQAWESILLIPLLPFYITTIIDSFRLKLSAEKV